MLFLGPGCTCGPGLRLIGRRYISFAGSASFGYNCRVEAYDSYNNQKFFPAIKIGAGAQFGDMLHIGAIGNMQVGENVLFGSKVLVIDHDHGKYSGQDCSLPSSSPIDRELQYRGDIYIGNRVWVGDNALIFGGASVGDGSVIAAGAIVNGVVPPGSICVGKNLVLKKFSSEYKNWIKENIK